MKPRRRAEGKVAGTTSLILLPSPSQNHSRNGSTIPKCSESEMVKPSEPGCLTSGSTLVRSRPPRESSGAGRGGSDGGPAPRWRESFAPWMSELLFGQFSRQGSIFHEKTSQLAGRAVGSPFSSVSLLDHLRQVPTLSSPLPSSLLTSIQISMF